MFNINGLEISQGYNIFGSSLSNYYDINGNLLNINKLFSYTYVGRWYKQTHNGVEYDVTNNCGSEIYFAVSGTNNITVNWYPMTTGAAYFAYSIDDGEIIRQTIRNGVIQLNDNGKHIVRIVTDGIEENIGKWETGIGFAFGGVDVGNGMLHSYSPNKKVIAFFGDSITEGIRSLGITTTGDMGDTNSSTNAFPWFCCEKLEAISHRVGYGATGVLNIGSFNICEKAIDYFYNGVLASDIYPNYIVMNHGTNDQDSGFAEAYGNALDKMHEKYNGVPIFCVVPFNQSHVNDIETCANSRDWCYFISTAGWDIECCDGLHPISAGAKKAGELLANQIQLLI